MPWMVVLALKNVKPMSSADAMFSAILAIKYVGSRQWACASRRKSVKSWYPQVVGKVFVSVAWTGGLWRPSA